jgi:cell division protein FtsB
VKGWWPIPALVVAALGYAWIDGGSGLRTWWQLRSDLAEADARIHALRQDVEARQQDAASLEDDEFAIERAIRERLEYARPGETVVRLSGARYANPRLP